MAGKVSERSAHLEEFRDSRIEFGDMLHGNLLDLRTRTVAILPEREQVPNLFDRKAKRACLMNEAQHLDIVLSVDSVSTVSSSDCLHEINALAVADHLGGNARCVGSLPDVHSTTRYCRMPVHDATFIIS